MFDLRNLKMIIIIENLIEFLVGINGNRIGYKNYDENELSRNGDAIKVIPIFVAQM